jgi:hypothetical protein
MRGWIAMRQIKLPLFLSFYFLIFLALPGYGIYFQMLSVLLIVFQVFITLTHPRKNKTNFPKSKFSILSIALIIVIPMQSLFNNITNPDSYYAEYSILFFIVVFSMFIIVNTIEFHLILNSFLLAAGAIILTIFATSTGSLIQALSLTYDPLSGLVRFAPFDLHPNLLGHIFGGFAVVFFSSFLYVNHKGLKYCFLALIVLSMILCIATSSRGGTLSSIIAMTSISALAAWKDKKKRRNFLLFISLALLTLLLAQGFGKVTAYLSSMLAYDSDYRGPTSGLSGRTDNWVKLLDTCFSSIKSMAIGNGLRSGSEELLGYNIDNGYLTLLYEMGLISSLVFLFLLMSALNKLRKSLLHEPSVLKAVAFGLFVFIIFESTVARYLLSIGNPVSLLAIYCMIGLRTILNTGAAPQTVSGITSYKLKRS